MMIYSIKDVSDILKKYKIKNFRVMEQFESITVSITFYNVHWYSFFLKKRIKNCKKHIQENKPLGSCFSYSVSSWYPVFNKIEEVSQ